MMTSYVALASTLCPACGRLNKDCMIVLDSSLKETFEYGKTYIAGIVLCEECQSNVDAGRIGLVEVNPNADLYDVPLEKLLMEIERTGRLFWVDKEVFTQEFLEKNRDFLFLEPQHLNQLLELLHYED